MLEDKFQKNATDILEKLSELGASSYRIGSSVGVNISSVKLKKSEVLEFARVIREAVLLERTGVLRADTDRFGKVVGWHKTSIANLKKEEQS